MTPEVQVTNNGQTVVVNIPMRMQRRGGRKRIVTPDLLKQKGNSRREYQESMALAIARAHLWKELVDSGRFASISDLAKAIGVDPSYAARIFRLTMLAPDIIDAVLSGSEPEGLTMRKLTEPIPMLWHEQRTALGFVTGGTEETNKYFSSQDCVANKCKTFPSFLFGRRCD